MSISILALERKAELQKLDFNLGEQVTVVKNRNPKEGIRRNGRIVWSGETFVCIWICSLVAPEIYGWRECFFYSDIVSGNVTVEKRKNFKRGFA